MFKILKYSFFDLMRSRWSYVYFLFYLVLLVWVLVPMWRIVRASGKKDF